MSSETSHLPEAVQAWLARGRMTRACSLEVFVLDHAGPGLREPSAPEATVVLHGFPSSSSDWHLALPHFARGRRVVLMDLPGFGLSEKPCDYSYSLLEQGEVVEAVLVSLGVTRAHLLAHDMGTTIACELLARGQRGLSRVEVASVLLTNGSVYPELSRLTVSQKLLRSPLAPLFTRLSSERVFRWQLRKILGEPVDEAELGAMWAQLHHRGGRALLPKLIGYVDDRYRHWHRFIGALRAVTCPVHVLWGPRDPVAVMAIAERLVAEVPGAQLERLEGLGHYPMLESPERFGAAVARFLERGERNLD